MYFYRMTSLADLGYWGLFIGSFIAATVLPFSSEVLLLVLLAYGYDLTTCLAVATLGNWLGGMTGYGLGYLGKTDWIERWFRISHEKVMKLQQRVERYGSAIAFFSWLPFIGDPLTVALGFFRVSLTKTALFMFIGKLFRYVLWGLLFKYGVKGWF
jgi:membrane protein YqaA with SNARE-associated domain